MRFLFLLLISLPLFAQAEQIEVMADSEIQATHEAQILILKKMLAAKQLNADEYMGQVETRFNAKFESYKIRKLGTASLTPEQKKISEDRFERERAAFYKRYLNLDTLLKPTLKNKIVVSISETKWVVEVSEVPGSLDLWLKRFESTETKIKFLIIPHLELVDLDWEAMKLSGEKPFLGALWSAWDKWKNTEAADLNIEWCDEVCERQWLQEKTSGSEGLSTYFGQDDEVQLVVDLKLQLKKLRTLVNGEVEYQISGAYSLHDYSSRSLLEAMGLGPELKRVNQSGDVQGSNSALANFFYRLAIPAFSRLKTWKEFKPYNQALQLVIEGPKNYFETEEIENELKLLTNGYSPRWELFALTKTTAEFRILYRGEEKSFKELITGLKELKSSYNAQYVWDTSSRDLRLKLVHE